MIMRIFLLLIAVFDDTILQFSSLILSSVAMNIIYILSKRFFLERKGLSDARVVSIAIK